MSDIRKLVVPVDFSEHSRRALEHAIRLAKPLGARIHVLHAMHMPIDTRMAGDWWATLRARAGEGLNEYLDQTESAGVPCESHLLEQYPAEAICELARELGADMIVMGSRGLSGLKHVLLGSVAERTIRMAPCPVLTVKSEDVL